MQRIGIALNLDASGLQAGARQAKTSLNDLAGALSAVEDAGNGLSGIEVPGGQEVIRRVARGGQESVRPAVGGHRISDPHTPTPPPQREASTPTSQSSTPPQHLQQNVSVFDTVLERMTQALSNAFSKINIFTGQLPDTLPSTPPTSQSSTPPTPPSTQPTPPSNNPRATSTETL